MNIFLSFPSLLSVIVTRLHFSFFSFRFRHQVIIISSNKKKKKKEKIFFKNFDVYLVLSSSLPGQRKKHEIIFSHRIFFLLSWKKFLNFQFFKIPLFNLWPFSVCVFQCFFQCFLFSFVYFFNYRLLFPYFYFHFILKQKKNLYLLRV